MAKFNPFLLKYLLSEDMPAHIVCKEPSIQQVKFEATSNVEDPQRFFANIAASDAEQYAKFAEEVIRIEIQYIQQGTDVYYLFARNGRQDRPDLGSYTFARPSSIEFGFVDKGAYKSLYKKHYSDWINTPDLTANTDSEMKLLTKTIEYDIMNALIGFVNQRHSLQIPLKPVDSNGMAIMTKLQPGKTN